MNEKKVIAVTTAATLLFAGTAFYIGEKNKDDEQDKFDNPNNLAHTSHVSPCGAVAAYTASRTAREAAQPANKITKGAIGPVKSGFGSAGVRSAVS